MKRANSVSIELQRKFHSTMQGIPTQWHLTTTKHSYNNVVKLLLIDTSQQLMSIGAYVQMN